ncbi:MAG: exosome complex exonuclease Rrp41 [Pyrobaculum arsenaticum]|uniref:Exosome complex component Rrp41 n=3 Tax=Pyrobaculum TaxID=2276 RepID=RRP41_PYRAR|nr:exosome complex exonuclease Rrp41 [Pyrobaculum arsenaticum]A4WM67.1 RecName: Full=Exosome complex component Rrp41 [Pyrobaculum arsenaticum DSM 13514]AFA38213.1 archaeal exosome-like complex exonuclease 1 [Pyrobaculum oguniense TE7]ABP51484.1 ribosomal RNA-processing protein RRP41/SKI6 [Pyrobaculum arsenaticum DSM 13514]MCY0890961.1 exosome complex exonuclease Rrp41 [Pyrobaculum arsenaticum]NYR16547.1 exosome complex exonuclease Rrp41 [Pyrobaculum arsenaticum]
MKKPPVPLLQNGVRADGRLPDQMREVKISVGVVSNADGSAMVSYGATTAVAAVYGPREMHPRHLSLPDRGVMRVRYHMAPFSTKDERKSPTPSRREIEISKVLREALEPAVLLEQYPRSRIDVFIEIIQADGSTRVASLTAASLALADAGIYMRDLVVGVSVGLVDGVVVLDLNGLEDNYGEGDLPVGYMPNLKRFVLLQLDGAWKREVFLQALNLAVKGAEYVYQIARDALKNKYMSIAEEIYGR